MKKRRGVTLLELLVVVVIVGILAAVGVPQFYRSMERSRAAKATYTLGAIRNAELSYRSYPGNNLYTTEMGDLDIDASDVDWTFSAADATTPGKGTAGPDATAKRTSAHNAGTAYTGATLTIDLNTGLICSSLTAGTPDYPGYDTGC